MKAALTESWEKLKTATPNLRIRDAAKTLGVSEAELLSTKIGSEVFTIKDDWADFLMKTPTLGKVMVLTRNEYCVHERKGEFENVSVSGNMGLVTGADIDLRIFLQNWKFGFYVEEIRANSLLRSFQFFDNKGEAVHKIYSTDKSNLDNWDKLKSRMVVDREKPIEVEKKVIAIKTVSEFEINLKDEFLTGWSVLKDTHDFFGLLKKYKLDRKEALQLASNRFTKKVANDTFSKLLKDCTDAEQEIMIFVGSAGVIQIHTGYANRLETMGPWFNVLDPEFNLHLRADLIAETWIVEKPTSDGNVTSLELFADDGTLILQLFGKRKPGIPQSANWEALIHNY